MTDATRSATEPLESRVIELERRLALFEAMADELSSVVADQGQTIDRLSAELKAVLGRIEDMAADMPGPGEDRPPPHY